MPRPRVKIKLGPADGKFDAMTSEYSIPVLARRRNIERWREVGYLNVEGVDVSSPADFSTELRIGHYEVVLWDADDAYTVDVLGRSYRDWYQIRTPAEAKRMAKEWAAGTLEAMGWGL